MGALPGLVGGMGRSGLRRGLNRSGHVPQGGHIVGWLPLRIAACVTLHGRILASRCGVGSGLQWVHQPEQQLCAHAAAPLPRAARRERVEAADC